MFDIGLLEIMIVLIIALLVIGPERMPEVARKLGAFMGKTRRFINQMKEDSPIQDTMKEVQQAMNLEEEKRHFENISNDLESNLSKGQSDMGVDLEEFKRPFGGDSQHTAGSQFNKAPSQPNSPKTDTAQQDTVEQAYELPAAEPIMPAEPKITPKPEPASLASAKPAQESEAPKS